MANARGGEWLATPHIQHLNYRQGHTQELQQLQQPGTNLRGFLGLFEQILVDLRGARLVKGAHLQPAGLGHPAVLMVVKRAVSICAKRLRC